MDVLVYMLLLTVSIVSGEYVIHLHGNESDSNTLQYYLCSNGSLFLNSDTILVLSHDVPHNLVHGPFCLVKNINNITIASNSSVKAAHIICHNDIVPTRGIGFINISGLYLYNLHIHQCGGILNTAITSNNTWLYFPIGLSAVLLFHHCNELHISNVSIDGGYYGYAMIAIDVHGETLFYNITVTDSIVCTSQQLKLVSPFCSGSGLLFLFIDKSDQLQSGQSLLIKSSTISRNVNQYLWGQNPIDILQFGVQQVPVFGAGGLTILFIGSSYKNGHVLLESNDVSSNSGDIAGGCLVLFLNTMSPTIPNLKFNTTPSIVNFYNNSVTGSYRARGGGLAIYVITHTIPTIETSLTITFNQIKFFNNTSGYYGGAVFIQVNCVSRILTTIYFNEIVWLYNEAKFGGSSLYIESNKHVPLTDDSYNISVVLSDIYARTHTQQYSLYKEVYDFITGSIFEFHNIDSISIKQQMFGNHFYYNHQQVLVVVNSSLFIQGKVRFLHNMAKISSFIRLESLSHVTFLAPADIRFEGENNFPPVGAITALGQPYSVYTDCPLKFEPNATHDITIHFVEVYIKGFYLLYSDGLQHCKLEHMYPLHNYLNKISSPPTGLQLCDPKTGQVMINNTKYQINTYPGKLIELSIIAMDFQRKPTLAKLFMYLDYSIFVKTKWILSKKEQLLHNGTCTNVSFRMFSGPCLLQKMEQNMHFAVLEGSIQMIIPILMMPCPVGFSISHGICTCDSFITNQKIANLCNIDTTSITIPSGNWLGHIQNHSYGFASVCPTRYCNSGLTDIDMTQKDYICHPNRR